MTVSQENQGLNIFVVGLDEDNLDTLCAVPGAEEFTFHPLLSKNELQHGEIDFPELLRKARATLDAFEAPSTRWSATGTSR